MYAFFIGFVYISGLEKRLFQEIVVIRSAAISPGVHYGKDLFEFCVTDPIRDAFRPLAHCIYRNFAPMVSTFSAAVVLKANQDIDLSEHPFIAGMLGITGTLAIYVANVRHPAQNPKLVWDALGNDPEFCKFCLDQGADPNYSEGEISLLRKACSVNDFKSVNYLIEAGADIHRVYWGEATLLSLICLYDESSYDAEFTNLARYLIQNSADISQTDSEGDTLLNIAIMNENLPLATEFLNGGQDPNVRNQKGQTPLHLIFILMSEYGSDFRPFIEALLSHGANPNIPDCRGITPLLYTCFHKFPEEAALLVQHGGDPFARMPLGNSPGYGQTALEIAARNRSTLNAIKAQLPLPHMVRSRQITGKFPKHRALKPPAPK